jgi:hypothetical protein
MTPLHHEQINDECLNKSTQDGPFGLLQNVNKSNQEIQNFVFLA